MKTSVIKAIKLILSMDAELLDILSVTAEMSIQSSVFALLIGLPIGIWLGACKVPFWRCCWVCPSVFSWAAANSPAEACCW